MRKLEGKVALVSGSGRGIGRAVALKLASEGARIVVNDIDKEPAQEVIEEIKRAGGEAVGCIGSVTAADFGERFVSTALDAWSDLHIVVNNAGYTWDGVIQKMTDAQWDSIVDVNLKAPFRILRATAEAIRALSNREKADGRQVIRKIVNVSSVVGISGNAGQANYSSAKAGVIGLTRTLSKEWGRYGVTVNCVAFGYIKTRGTQPLGSEQAWVDIEGRKVKVGIQPAVLEALERSIPLGRGGLPEDAAGAAYLFCIPESDYVSGQVLICGGGLNNAP